MKSYHVARPLKAQVQSLTATTVQPIATAMKETDSQIYIYATYDSRRSRCYIVIKTPYL